MSKRNESLSYYLKKYNIDKDDGCVRSILRQKYGVSIKKLTNEELVKLYIEHNEKQKLKFGKFRNIEINGVTYKSLRDASIIYWENL